ncbi:type III secretion system chaperone [Acanthopleuribacter pedis]|uniref:Type III secretion system chaperone n=1 Tax=Acanthopleuribacter pedis TaxID=442870 RepID=A0A8J7U6U4_9BACT|nr:type III secretion system chaperone [Acanthopleuribacter pedis]MBO1323132.1 type III secretion system chaperone [Acanthopleuribacter pedis]
MKSPFPVIQCLAELARVHHADQPVFNELGFARIPTANGLTFDCFVPPEGGEMIVFIVIGEIPAAKRAGILIHALRANLHQDTNFGSVLAYHEERNLLTVQQTWMIHSLEPAVFVKAMEAMKQVADLWLNRIEPHNRGLEGNKVSASLPFFSEMRALRIA